MLAEGREVRVTLSSV